MVGLLVALAAVVDLAVLVFTIRKLFPEPGSFLEALKYWFQPWWLSMLRGEWGEDVSQSLRLMGAFAPTVALVAVEWVAISSLGG